MLCEAKLKDGRDKADAIVLDVVIADEAVDGDVDDAVVGEVGVVVLPTAPDRLFDTPCFGACCFRSWRALARFFSCARTKLARFCRR